MKVNKWLVLCLCSVVAIVCGCGRHTNSVSEEQGFSNFESDSTKTDQTPVPLNGRLVQDLLSQDGGKVAPDPPADFDCIPQVHGNKYFRWTVDWLEGDLNRDGAVTGQDVFLVAACFGLMEDDPGWIAAADTNRDGRVDGLDIYPVALNFNQSLRGWTVYGSENWDGSDAVEEFSVDFKDQEIGEPYERNWNDSRGEPRYYFVRALAADGKLEGKPSPVKPAIPFVTMSTRDNMIRIETVDRSSTSEPILIRDLEEGDMELSARFSADASTLLCVDRAPNPDQVFTIYRDRDEDYGWIVEKFSTQLMLHVDAVGTWNINLSGEGATALMTTGELAGSLGERYLKLTIYRTKPYSHTGVALNEISLEPGSNGSFWDLKSDAMLTRSLLGVYDTWPETSEGGVDAAEARLLLLDEDCAVIDEIDVPETYIFTDYDISGDGKTAIIGVRERQNGRGGCLLADLDSGTLEHVFDLDGFDDCWMYQSRLSYDGKRFFCGADVTDPVGGHWTYRWVKGKVDQNVWEDMKNPLDPRITDFSPDGRVISSVLFRQGHKETWLIDFDSGETLTKFIDSDYFAGWF